MFIGQYIYIERDWRLYRWFHICKNESHRNKHTIWRFIYGINRCLPSEINVKLQSLRHLTIKGQHSQNFKKFLSICPRLVSFGCWCDNTIRQMSLKNYYFPSMKALRLGRIDKFLFHNGQFEQFLSVFPNLIQFHLTVDQCQTSKWNYWFRQISNVSSSTTETIKNLELPNLYVVSCLQTRISSLCRITSCVQMFLQMSIIVINYFIWVSFKL